MQHDAITYLLNKIANQAFSGLYTLQMEGVDANDNPIYAMKIPANQGFVAPHGARITSFYPVGTHTFVRLSVDSFNDFLTQHQHLTNG